MSDLVEFLYRSDDKKTIETTLVSVFDTCCTDIDVTSGYRIKRNGKE